MILIMFTLGIDYIAGSGKEVVLIFCPLSISVLYKTRSAMCMPDIIEVGS